MDSYVTTPIRGFSMSKLRIVFVGTGGIALRHSNFLKDCPDAEIVGGCDVSEENVKGLWDRTWVDGEASARPPAFTDIGRMFDQTNPEAVVICTPHTLHYEHCVQALERGCHVLVEKPMVTRAEDAYALRKAVKEAGTTFVIGFNTPCSAEFAYIRGAIRDKTLGDLQQVCGFLAQPWLRILDRLGGWRLNPELSGGGQAYDSGAHILNSLCWSVESDVAKVQAFVDFRGQTVDVNSNINVLFANGVMASIVISGVSESQGSHMSFIFSDGRIDVDGWSAKWMKVFDRQGEVKYPQVPDELNAGSAAKNFIDAILGRSESRTSVENGVVLTELMDAIYESAQTGAIAEPKRKG